MDAADQRKVGWTDLRAAVCDQGADLGGPVVGVADHVAHVIHSSWRVIWDQADQAVA